MLAVSQDPEKPFRSYVGVPILLRRQVSGFINVFSSSPNAYEMPEIERLTSFAQQAAIAIENARLYAESQRLAAIEERQRLARELHDSVSQTLFTATAMAESALRQWDVSQPRAYGLLQDVHRLSQAALAEMRVLLLELRPSTLTSITLKQLLEQYLKPIQVRHELELTVNIPDELRLPPSVQMGFYRIVQEAFNNIDKHAQATKVYTSVTETDLGIELVIRDNGRGFDDDGVQGTSLGLQIMHERANEIGARLEITSTSGQGTRVYLVLPTEKYKG
jgi:signal transduction histidine kinase